MILLVSCALWCSVGLSLASVDHKLNIMLITTDQQRSEGWKWVPKVYGYLNICTKTKQNNDTYALARRALQEGSRSFVSFCSFRVVFVPMFRYPYTLGTHIIPLKIVKIVWTPKTYFWTLMFLDVWNKFRMPPKFFEAPKIPFRRWWRASDENEDDHNYCNQPISMKTL